MTPSAAYCDRIREADAALPHNPTPAQIAARDDEVQRVLREATAYYAVQAASVVGAPAALRAVVEVGACATAISPIVVDYGLPYTGDPAVCAYWTQEALDALSPSTRAQVIATCGIQGYVAGGQDGQRLPLHRRDPSGPSIRRVSAAPDGNSPDGSDLLVVGVGLAIVAGLGVVLVLVWVLR